MNRTIKFRAWDKARKEMCIVDRLTFMFETDEGIMAEVIESDSKSISYKRMVTPEILELMQFTGLLDKNGKEIYEGDVIEYKSSRKELSTVFFDEGSFKTTQPSSRTTRTLGHHLSKYQCEVIGNIYENPELLNP